MVRKKQVPLGFIESAQKLTEEGYIKFLEEKGYVISPPQKETVSINTIDGLLNFFYSSMYKYNKDRNLRFTPMHEDRKFISNFIKSRQIGGIKKSVAIAECTQIVETMFKYEKYLGLSSPITSTTILCQDWFINKVINIINNEDKYIEEEFNLEVDRLLGEVGTSVEFQKKIINDLELMYKNVGSNDGEQKE